MQPKRRKYRKEFRGSMPGMSLRGSTLSYGEFGLKATSRGWVNGREIEAARRTISHYTKRTGRVFIRIFPHKPYTGRPAGSRMGSGKGDIQGYVAVVTPGRILFEITGVTKDTALEALRLAGHKISVRTRFIERA